MKNVLPITVNAGQISRLDRHFSSIHDGSTEFANPPGEVISFHMNLTENSTDSFFCFRDDRVQLVNYNSRDIHQFIVDNYDYDAAVYSDYGLRETLFQITDYSNVHRPHRHINKSGEQLSHWLLIHFKDAGRLKIWDIPGTPAYMNAEQYATEIFADADYAEKGVCIETYDVVENDLVFINVLAWHQFQPTERRFDQYSSCIAVDGCVGTIENQYQFIQTLKENIERRFK